MRPLERSEIVPLGPYAEIRDRYRRAVIAHKRDRRVEVGPSVALIFEDRETLRFQVQEMLFVERIRAPEAVQHEIDVYNELMPAEGELSATLMIQITEPGRIRAELDRLIGIDEHVSLSLGEGADAERIAARFDPKQFEEERISAVQYIRFRLDAERARRFADPDCPAALEIDHPAYAHRAPLAPKVRASLARGLASEPPNLLLGLLEGAAGDATEDDEEVRVRPGEAPETLLIESRDPIDTLDDRAWASLLDAVGRRSDPRDHDRRSEDDRRTAPVRE